MTLPTFTGARDEILGLFNTAWIALAPAVNGGLVPEIDWPGVDTGDYPPITKPRARIFIRHNGGGQRTFGETGNRRFQRTGFVTVQVFTPVTNRDGLTLLENLATIARDAYEGVGTASGIWFRNVRIQEAPTADGANQANVIAEFEYQELK